jgi:hypothetical protein
MSNDKEMKHKWNRQAGASMYAPARGGESTYICEVCDKKVRTSYACLPTYGCVKPPEPSNDKEMKLSPCPFCNGKGEPSEGGFGPVNGTPVFEFHDVTCKGCFAIVHGSSREDAIKNWNTRHSDPLLAKAVEALEWVALQSCRQDAEGSSEDMDCRQTGSCITEYCLSCYAKQALQEIERGDGNG